MQHQILRIPAVLQMTGLTRSAVYAKVAKGEFPKIVKLGARASGFVAAEVQEWVQARIAESRAGSSN